MGRSFLPPAPKIWSAAASNIGWRSPTTLRRLAFIVAMSALTGATISSSSCAGVGRSRRGSAAAAAAAAGGGPPASALRLGTTTRAGHRAPLSPPLMLLPLALLDAPLPWWPTRGTWLTLGLHPGLRGAEHRVKCCACMVAHSQLRAPLSSRSVQWAGYRPQASRKENGGRGRAKFRRSLFGVSRSGVRNNNIVRIQ